LLAAAVVQKTCVRDAVFVDRGGQRLSRAAESMLTGGLIGNLDTEMLRDGLIALLYGVTQQGAEYLFADRITTLDGPGDSIMVSFERALAQRWHKYFGDLAKFKGLI
jgi:hypothetical protein